MSIYLLFINIAKVFEGTTRGLGKYMYVTTIIVLSYYMISIPIIFYGLHKGSKNLFYIWFGHSVGGLCSIVFYLILLLFYFDYNAI